MTTEEIKSILETMRPHFRWLSSDGRLSTIDEMATTHIFHAMKKCAGKLFDLWSSKPADWQLKHGVMITLEFIASSEETSLDNLIWIVLTLINEIEQRADISEKFISTYVLIAQNLFQLIPAAEAAIVLPKPTELRKKLPTSQMPLLEPNSSSRLKHV